MDLALISMSLMTILVLLLPLHSIAPALAFIFDDKGGTLQPESPQPCALRDSRMSPTYEPYNDVYAVWQIPPNPKSILYLAHGDEQDPLGFWDPSLTCPQCYGRPEDRRVTLDAVRNGHAFVVVKSAGRGFVADPPDLAAADFHNVIGFLNKFRRDHSLEDLPLSLLGHSRGGFFVNALVTKLPVHAMVLMCSQGLPELEAVASPDWFPPTLFIYMGLVKDERLNHKANANGNGIGTGNAAMLGDAGIATISKVEEAIAILKAHNVSVTAKMCDKKAITPTFFAERIRCMSDGMSMRIYEAYNSAGWLDSDGYLILDPYFADWEAVLWHSHALPYCKADDDLCLTNYVVQELKLAYSTHSLTSLENDLIFSWLESKITAAGALLPGRIAQFKPQSKTTTGVE